MWAAIGLEERANVVTRGRFRIDPGECNQVLDGALGASMVYMHAPSPPVYGSAPQPQAGHGELCIRDGNFDIRNARAYSVTQQARFTAEQPSNFAKGPTINIAEEADHDYAQARVVGIQRLLVIVGYDAYPIESVQGVKTQAALKKFLNDRKLPADALLNAAIFDTLLDAAANLQGAGHSWYNDTITQ